MNKAMSQFEAGLPQVVRFTKYDEQGAYHWKECDKRSRTYNPALDARYEALVSRVNRANRVLDVGCGDGYLMAQIKPHAEEVIGIDFELSGVRLATHQLQGLGNCFVAQASCYSLPFPDHSFDVVLLADVIEHLEDPDACVREIQRVLHPSGYLFLTTPKWRPDRRWDVRHVKEFKPNELAQCLMEHFSSVQLTFFWPSIWSRIYRTRIGWRLVRKLAQYLYNPFLSEGQDPRKYGQILAVCGQASRSLSK